MRQNRNYAIRLQDISEALTKSGYTKLDQQAKALGIDPAKLKAMKAK